MMGSRFGERRSEVLEKMAIDVTDIESLADSAVV